MATGVDQPVIDFSQNLNPFGLPFSPEQLMPVLSGLLTSYGDSTAANLRQTVAAFLAIESGHLTVGAGSTEVIFTLPRLLDATRAVIPLPAFWEYEVANVRADREVLTVPQSEKKDFNYDFEQLSSVLRPHDALYLSNVCNPTGAFFTKADFMPLLLRHPETQFVVDETYLLFRDDFERETLSREACQHDNLHIVLSFSKFFSMPGVRAGFLISNKALIEKYDQKSFIPYSVNGLAVYASLIGVGNAGYISRARTYIVEERARLEAVIAERFGTRLQIIKPNGNFILLRLLTGQTDAEVGKALLRWGIKVRLGSEVPGLSEQWIRFSIRTTEDNDALLQGLDAVLTPSTTS